MRTRTFNSIVELLGDRRWHTADEVGRKTHYPREWIDALKHESLLDIEEHEGQLMVRLRTEAGERLSDAFLT